MSGAGRRTIHRETGSGGWPNGLTVDYLEKRILWIDARSAPGPPGAWPPRPRGQGGAEKARRRQLEPAEHAHKGPGRGLSGGGWAGKEAGMEEGRARAATARGWGATAGLLMRL